MKFQSKIESLRRKISPKKKLILCIDGVAGCAKMAQQRQRRFRSSLPSNESQNGECEIVITEQSSEKNLIHHALHQVLQ